MLVIRLQRTGRENEPTYRIVLSEKTKSAKKGKLEILGHYLPARKKPVLEFKQDRVLHWVKMGAQPSDTMARVFKNAGVEGMEKFIKRYKKQKSKSAPAEEPAAPAPAAAAPAAEAPKAEEAKA